MSGDLKGKVAVVTGGGDGIGKAAALLMAQEGANVVINDIDRRPDGIYLADKVAKEIVSAGGNAAANYDSVVTMAGGENIINTAISHFGRIDILLNNAGNYYSIPITEMTEAQWDLTMAVHLKGHFACSKPAVLKMIEQKSGGRIINISSRGAMLAAKAAAYAAAKAGILGFTSALAIELKQYGITANAVLPSAITKLFPGQKKGLGDNMPLTTLVDPEYIAPIIAYLASDKAQKITGRFIYSCGADLCLYDRPLQLPGPHTFVRKTSPGKWTLNELNDIVPNILGLG